MVREATRVVRPLDFSIGLSGRRSRFAAVVLTNGIS